MCPEFRIHSRYALFIRDKSPTNCNAQLSESNFKTHFSAPYYYPTNRSYSFIGFTSLQNVFENCLKTILNKFLHNFIHNRVYHFLAQSQTGSQTFTSACCL
ncbi:DUF6783 domain-containing protein [uncultured Robinsoniella sp.]|uniref:DUF6783 domain-containing protein n=1 Tax=uncultured Robinsoniella sp. TaxID=904190 RepID=UPI00374EBE57